MRKIEYVIGDNPQQFCDRYNEACERIATVGEFSNDVVISPTEAYLFYDIPEDDEETGARFCCECSLFHLRKGCLLGRVNSHGRKTLACEKFTTEVIDNLVEVIRDENQSQNLS